MKHRSLRLIRLEVTGRDIDEMYERYDSGMADHTTANAISLALRRQLKSAHAPRIISATRHHACRLEIGREALPLPSEVYWWLDRTRRGAAVPPMTFAFVVPEEMLREAPSPTEAQLASIAA